MKGSGTRNRWFRWFSAESGMYFENEGMIRLREQGLTQTDAGFAILRVLTILGGWSWLLLTPLASAQRLILISILSWFCAYSCLLYLGIVLWPNRVRRLYLVALTLDLAFIYFLIRFTGGYSSSFFLAFYLLVAIHSFYYGVRVGLLVAACSSVLYVLDLFDSGTSLYWTDLAMRLLFLFLVAISLGLLSEDERRDKRKIEKLNQDLKQERANLERAYGELKQAQEQVIQAEKLASIGTLAAGVAHEIYNPLDGIQNCILTILNEPEDHEQTRRYLMLVQDGLIRMENTVRKLLNFAHRSELQIERLDLHSVLTEVLDFVTRRLQEHFVTLERVLAPGPLWIVGDRHYLHQVFLNMILNAVDAMSNGGTLTVTTEQGRGDATGKPILRVRITDTGVGIPKNNLHKIFDPFFSTKAVGEGTGLGLAISLGIVKEHHGDITVESEEGKGTTFTVMLPTCQEDMHEESDSHRR